MARLQAQAGYSPQRISIGGLIPGSTNQDGKWTCNCIALFYSRRPLKALYYCKSIFFSFFFILVVSFQVPCDGVQCQNEQWMNEPNCMLPSRDLLQGHPCLFQQVNAKTHFARVTTAWLRSKRVGTGLPACSQDLSPMKMCGTLCSAKYDNRDPRLFSNCRRI